MRLNKSLFMRLDKSLGRVHPICRFISASLSTTQIQPTSCGKPILLLGSIQLKKLNVINQQLNFHIRQLRFFHHHSKTSIEMTNKTNKLFQQQASNKTEAYVKKPFHTSTKTNQNNDAFNNTTIQQSTNFRSMASIQKLVTEPTREHIENIRHLLKGINAKDNNDQSITMVKDHETGIASVCIRSAAKNGISCKMMSDLLDIVDELYSWTEGKGVILYGHGGFFCSGKLSKKR